MKNKAYDNAAIYKPCATTNMMMECEEPTVAPYGL
jgi:hypothetical protein